MVSEITRYRSPGSVGRGRSPAAPRIVSPRSPRVSWSGVVPVEWTQTGTGIAGLGAIFLLRCNFMMLMADHPDFGQQSL